MIIVNNEEALRVECDLVTIDEVNDLILTLESELQHSNMLGNAGVGLAAPQIGIKKDIAIIRLSPELSLNLVNCQIAHQYDPAIFRQEGCLSFPGRVEDTTRYQEVHITNNLVYPHSFVTTGLLAVVCQHEIDHLQKKLFLDRIVEVKKELPRKIKVGPNDPCICGKIDLISNKVKKFKKCCGK
jgi:peptide deformylase